MSHSIKLDAPADTNHLAKSRTRRLLEGAFSTTISKVVILLTNILSIPITIRYLGTESFGVWTTISTVLSMLLVLDLGVANSLTNYISESYARDDQKHASTYATTALCIMVVFAGLLGGVGTLLWPHFHWFSLFHISTNSSIQEATVGHAVAAAFIVFLIGLPASLAPKILGGYQELRWASIFQATGSVLNLLSVVLLTRMHAGLVALVTASSAALVIMNLLCLLWIWTVRKPWLFPRFSHLKPAAARNMVQTGGEFFILQIAALIVFNSDNLIVTHYLGPSQVASYSVAWRLAGYAAVAQTLLAPALWPAFSEAFARGDMTWVRKTFRQTMFTTMSMAILFATIFAFFGQFIIRIWASSGAVPEQNLLRMMCVWVLISTFMNNTSIVLVAKGDTRLQAWCSFAAAIINIGISIHLVQRIGAIGVILGTIISYLLVLVAPQTWKVYQVLKGQNNG